MKFKITRIKKCPKCKGKIGKEVFIMYANSKKELEDAIEKGCIVEELKNGQ